MTKATKAKLIRRGMKSPDPLPFDTFQAGTIPPLDDKLIEATMREFPGVAREDIVRQLEEVQADRIFINSRYQVNIAPVTNGAPGWPKMLHLSIKRRDKERVGPEKYRDFMAIKDRLIGPECEAVELYPARSREYDTTNQYHLFVIEEPGARFPFGYDFGERVVSEHTYQGGAKQQPFDQQHHRVKS